MKIKPMINPIFLPNFLVVMSQEKLKKFVNVKKWPL